MSVSAIPTAGQAVDGVVLLGGRASELRLGAAVDLYLGYQRRRGRTRETIRSASSMLGPFVAWAGSDTHVAQITRASVELEFFAEWYEEFEARHGYPPSTSTSRCLLGTIQCLFQFLYEFDLLRLPDGTPARNPLTRLDIPPAAPPRQNALKPE